MKKIITITIFLIENLVCAQTIDISTIDTSNYYDYNILRSENQKYLKGKELHEFFLQRHEVTNIIYDELIKTKHSILTNVLYKLNNSQYINLDAYDLDKDIGFIYIGIVRGGGKEMRSIKSPYLESHKADYVQIVRAENGEMIEANVIKKIPDNIKIVWVELYRFQYTENKDDDKYLITKDIITKILRQDIAAFIKVKS